jgi:hypothetical protein
MNNCWSTFKGTIVSWNFGLPDLDRDQAIDFVRQVLNVGRREGVYDVVETAKPYRFVAQDGYSYADYLVTLQGATSDLPLFPLSAGAAATEEGRLRTPATLAYYSSDEVLESSVSDVGEFKERFRSDGLWIPHVPPIAIRHYAFDRLWGAISIKTDIWFPWVVGYEEMGEGDWVAPTRIGEMYDNRALAARHTVRLNRFLASVKELVESIGGTWEPDDPGEIYGWYLAMYKPWGIDLDVDPLLPFPQLGGE